jgi:pyruvate formate lyase activating enzyme
MLLVGYQAVTIVDYPHQLASICFTGGCPLRCGFCHNPNLVLPELFNQQQTKEDEYLKYLKQRRNMLDGVVISGGEPLMQAGIIEFLSKIKTMGYKIKVDTCGVYPKQLQEILNKGLVDYVALDFKNEKDHYAETIGRKNQEGLWNKWEESLEVLRVSHVEYELRTTILKELHTQEGLLRMVQMLQPKEVWYLQGFVQKEKILNDYVDSSQALCKLSSYSPHKLEELAGVLVKHHTQTYVR